MEPILALYAGESSEIREHTNLGVKQLSITYGGAQYAVIETTQALSIEFWTLKYIDGKQWSSQSQKGASNPMRTKEERI